MNLLIHDYGGYAFSLQLAKQLSATHQVSYLYSASQLIQRCGAENTPSFTSLAVSASRPLEKYNLVQRLLWERDYGRQVASQIRRIQPDLVFSANTPLDSQVIIQAACHEVGAKFIFWFQDAIGLAMDAILRKKIPLVGGWIGSYYTWLEKRLLRRSDAIVLISERFQGLLDSWQINSVPRVVIANWAPLPEIPVLPAINPWSVQNHLHETINLVYTGILGFKHNPGLFVQMAKHFQSNPLVRVVVVSSGGGADWLAQEKQQQQLDNLVLLPFQPLDEYPNLLASARVLLATINPEASQYSIPSKVLSYLCAGRTIALAIPPENEAAALIQSIGAGVVCDPQESAAWFSQIEALVADPLTCRQMGANARQYAETHFNVNTIANKFEQLIVSS